MGTQTGALPKVTLSLDFSLPLFCRPGSLLFLLGMLVHKSLLRDCLWDSDLNGCFLQSHTSHKWHIQDLNGGLPEPRVDTSITTPCLISKEAEMCV